MSYFVFFCWLFIISGSGSIILVGEERELICLLLFIWFLLERFLLPLGAWDGLRYFIVALPQPSI